MYFNQDRLTQDIPSKLCLVKAHVGDAGVDALTETQEL